MGNLVEELEPFLKKRNDRRLFVQYTLTSLKYGDDRFVQVIQACYDRDT